MWEIAQKGAASYAPKSVDFRKSSHLAKRPLDGCGKGDRAGMDERLSS